eukprot:gene23311-30551_t
MGQKSSSNAPDDGTEILINLNTAREEELEDVKRIGKKVAKRICCVREEGGQFFSWDDLELRVHGVAKGKVEVLRASHFIVEPTLQGFLRDVNEVGVDVLISRGLAQQAAQALAVCRSSDTIFTTLDEVRDQLGPTNLARLVKTLVGSLSALRSSIQGDSEDEDEGGDENNGPVHGGKGREDGPTAPETQAGGSSPSVSPSNLNSNLNHGNGAVKPGSAGTLGVPPSVSPSNSNSNLNNSSGAVTPGEPPRRGRGRPRKNPLPTSPSVHHQAASVSSTPVTQLGNPSPTDSGALDSNFNNIVGLQASDSALTTSTLQASSSTTTTITLQASSSTPTTSGGEGEGPPKRGRGRPRKHPLPLPLPVGPAKTPTSLGAVRPTPQQDYYTPSASDSDLNNVVGGSAFDDPSLVNLDLNLNSIVGGGAADAPSLVATPVLSS